MIGKTGIKITDNKKFFEKSFSEIAILILLIFFELISTKFVLSNNQLIELLRNVIFPSIKLTLVIKSESPTTTILDDLISKSNSFEEPFSIANANWIGPSKSPKFSLYIGVFSDVPVSIQLFSELFNNVVTFGISTELFKFYFDEIGIIGDGNINLTIESTPSLIGWAPKLLTLTSRPRNVWAWSKTNPWGIDTPHLLIILSNPDW